MILSRAKSILNFVLGKAFILAGLNHFWHTEFYLRIMPDYLPFPLFLVYLSGVTEAGLGALLLIKRFTKLAAWGLVANLIAVAPANLQMALHSERYPEFSQRGLWIRLFLQLLLVAWALWYTRPDKEIRLRT